MVGPGQHWIPQFMELVSLAHIGLLFFKIVLLNALNYLKKRELLHCRFAIPSKLPFLNKNDPNVPSPQ